MAEKALKPARAMMGIATKIEMFFQVPMSPEP